MAKTVAMEIRYDEVNPEGIGRNRAAYLEFVTGAWAGQPDEVERVAEFDNTYTAMSAALGLNGPFAVNGCGYQEEDLTVVVQVTPEMSILQVAHEAVELWIRAKQVRWGGEPDCWDFSNWYWFTGATIDDIKRTVTFDME